MSSLSNKIIHHYQLTGVTNHPPVSNPFSVRLNEEIDNVQTVYLLGYTFQNSVTPAPMFYYIQCDDASIPIRIQTNGPSNLKFPMYLDNAKTGTDNRIAWWYPIPQPIATVRNTTKRISQLTFTITNPDGTLTAWTNMSMWFMVSTPGGDFPMKKTNPMPRIDPPYFDKRLGQEDVESILYR